MTKRLLNTKVKVFSSDYITNRIRNEWGSCLKALSECLVDGTTPRPVTSITKHSIPSEDDSYWFYKVELSRKHNYWSERTVIQFKGCTNQLFNREFRVQETEETSFIIAFDKTTQQEDPGDPGVVAETVENVPSLGYEIAFEKSGVKVFTPKEKLNSTWFLRIEDHEGVSKSRYSSPKYISVMVLPDMLSIDDIEPRPARPVIPSFYTDKKEQIGCVYADHSNFGRIIITGDNRTVYCSVFRVEKLNNSDSSSYFYAGEYKDYADKIKPLNIALKGQNSDYSGFYGSLSSYMSRMMLPVHQSQTQRFPFSFSYEYLDLNSNYSDGLLFQPLQVRESETLLGRLRHLYILTAKPESLSKNSNTLGSLFKNNIDENGEISDTYFMAYSNLQDSNMYLFIDLNSED